VKDKEGFRRSFGRILDDLLDSLENYESAFLGVPTDGNGYKIDDCIRRHLPELLDAHLTPFAEGNEGCPLDIDVRERWGKYETELTKEKLMVNLGMATSVMYERLAYVKGGGTLGENVGKLTKFTHDQVIEATKIASSGNCLKMSKSNRDRLESRTSNKKDFFEMATCIFECVSF